MASTDLHTRIDVNQPAQRQSRLLYAVGGHQFAPVLQNAPAEGYETRYDRAVILSIDIEHKSVTRIVDYETPRDRRPADDPQILFKSATLQGNRVYVPTQTEILIYRLPNWESVGQISLPMFNDVHHARPSRQGGVIAANTGLDMVVDVTLDGQIQQEWSVIGEDPWLRFSRDVDYRKVRTTKPHKAHPNFVFYLGDELWVTRFEQRDAISLMEPDRRIVIGGERIHDGVVQGDHIYFTAVDGKVAIANRRSLEVERVIDLQTFYPKGTLLGWTRGIAVDGDGFWVAFSRMRHTRFRENVEWVMRRFKQELPTRIAYFDLTRQRVGPSFDLEPAGLNTIFSILVGS